MAAFNTVSGTPGARQRAHLSRHPEAGVDFDGVVVSDWTVCRS